MSKIVWNDENLKILQQCNGKTIKEIKNMLPDIKVATIRKKCKQLNINIKKVSNTWTKEEDDYLKENYKKVSLEEMSKQLNRSKDAVYLRINHNLNLTIRLWTEEDINILKNNCNGKNTYIDLQKLIPHKTRDAIEFKCQQLGLNKYIKRNNCYWTQEDEELFKELYPLKHEDELLLIFKDKTKDQLIWKANYLNLKKNEDVLKQSRQNNISKAMSFCWSESLEDELNNNIKNKRDVEEIKDIFYKNYNVSSDYLEKKLRDKNYLIKNHLDKIKYILNKKSLDNLTEQEYIQIYMLYLENRIQSLNFLKLDKIIIVKMFLYFLKIKNINHSRKQWTELRYKDLFKESKLHNYIKNRFSTSYDFICECFPNFDFKPWEFRKVHLPNGFWKNEKNIFNCIEHSLNMMIKDNVISSYSDAINLTLNTLQKYIVSTIDNYGNGIKSYLIMFYEENNIKYDTKNVYDGYFFDSKQERDIYCVLKKYNLFIKKGRYKDKMENIEERESYIPDFLIEYNNKIIIIEYYGWYLNKPNVSKNIIKYKEKTHRKNKFYKSLKDIYFIDLYPEDLKSDMQGVRKKLTSFFMKNFNIELIQ